MSVTTSKSLKQLHAYHEGKNGQYLLLNARLNAQRCENVGILDSPGVWRSAMDDAFTSVHGVLAQRKESTP